MRARHLCVVLALLPVMIAASAPRGALHANDVTVPLPSPTPPLPPGYQSTPAPTQTTIVPPTATASDTPTPTQTAPQTPSDTATSIAISPTVAAVVSGTVTAPTTATASVDAAAASATAVSPPPTATATPTVTALPTATPTVAQRPSSTPTPVRRVVPTATPRPRPRHKAARHHATPRHRRHTTPRRTAVSSRHKTITRSRTATHRSVPHRVAPGGPLQELTVLAQPRTVGKNGSVTIRVQVDARAQLAVVTVYGSGLAQQRWITVSRGGVSLIRLRALAPAGCRGKVVARVYVTATGNGRAMTRATTFTVGCSPARMSTARKPARP